MLYNRWRDNLKLYYRLLEKNVYLIDNFNNNFKFLWKGLFLCKTDSFNTISELDSTIARLKNYVRRVVMK